MQGISRTLIEELKWGPNGITSRDWATYPVIRFKAMPKFDFQIINRIDQPVLGAGEVLITNVPAAIANAIFDATGADAASPVHAGPSQGRARNLTSRYTRHGRAPVTRGFFDAMNDAVTKSSQHVHRIRVANVRARSYGPR